MKRSLFVMLLLSLLAGVGAGAQAPPPQTLTFQFVNGQWFDGERFVPRTFYSVGGLLTRARPAHVDRVLDLGHGFVVPPFGDTHNHMFDDPTTTPQRVRMFLHDGIFYASTRCNSLQGARAVVGEVNTPTTVDVQYAQGGLTGNNSHPIPLYEALGLGYYTPQDRQTHQQEILHSRARENDCYYVIDTEADLTRKWPMILAGRPDIIKVFLLHSEDYEKRKAAQGYGEGIDPKLLPQIVAHAHAAGLRVAAHVDSAMDYHNALLGGVDEMAHLPGYSIERAEAVADYRLSDADVALTARRGVLVVPTASLADSIEDAQDRARTRANQIDNLRRLKRAGVKFGVGADRYGTDALKEALCLSGMGLWDNREMLKMWCEDTPQAIFPRRKVGALRDGWEASFLVLDRDPLQAFGNVQSIRSRFKQGHLLDPGL